MQDYVLYGAGSISFNRKGQMLVKIPKKIIKKTGFKDNDVVLFEKNNSYVAIKPAYRK